MKLFLRKLFYYLWLIAIVGGILPGFFSVSLFHSKKLLSDGKEIDHEDKRAGRLFMAWSTAWAIVIYCLITYFILS